MNRKRKLTPIDPVATMSARALERLPVHAAVDDIVVTWDEEATRLYRVQELRELLQEVRKP